MSAAQVEEIVNFLRLSERIGTAGQPTAEQITAIKDAGYEVVVCLLPDTYRDVPNEPELVTAQGMEFVRIPVVWTAPKVEDAERFFAVMDANADKNVFVHCAANKRVSAFMYLYRLLRQQANIEEAFQDLRKIWEPDSIWQAFILEASVTL